jgi:hypothetical protein
MSVTFSEAEARAGEWLTVGKVATSCHVSERTVRRWVSEGVVQSRVSREGLRESRLILRESLPATSTVDTPYHATSGSPDTPRPDMATPSVTPQPDTSGHVIEPLGISPDTHALSDIATVTRRAERAEDRLELMLSD